MDEEIVQTKGSEDFCETSANKMLDQRRRTANVPKKGFEPTQMWDRYHEIARRIFLGQKNTAIANDMDLTPATVSYVRNSEMVQEKLAAMQIKADAGAVNIQSRIKELAPAALKLMENAIVDGKIGSETIPAPLRLAHAEKLMDRAGHAAPKEVRNLNLHGHFNKEDIEGIKQRAIDRAIDSAIVVEVVEEPEV